MNSKTYISDPKIWEAFYKNMAEKKFSPYKYKPKQIGRGMRKKKKYIIPIRPHSQLEFDNPIPQVTPVAAVEQRAITEHLKDVKEGVPFVKVNSKSIKRPSQHSSVIPSKILKTSTSQKRKKKKNSKKTGLNKKKKLTLKKKKTANGKSEKRQTPWVKKASKRQKKTFKIDSYKNVFKQ